MKKIAFVGESGSGKSTLIKLLLGLLKYDKGEIRLGDMELRDICLMDLYDKVRYLHKIHLFLMAAKRKSSI